MKPTRIIEICANSAQSCVEAEAGGAKRVELCAGIPEGGTTPSYGEIRTAQALTSSIEGARRSLWLLDERRGYRCPFDAPVDRDGPTVVCHLSSRL